MAGWTPTDEAMPPEGEFVDAIASNGNHLRLKCQGHLWHFTDGSPYLWFTPALWRPVKFGPARAG